MLLTHYLQHQKQIYKQGLDTFKAQCLISYLAIFNLAGVVGFLQTSLALDLNSNRNGNTHTSEGVLGLEGGELALVQDHL